MGDCIGFVMAARQIPGWWIWLYWGKSLFLFHVSLDESWLSLKRIFQHCQTCIHELYLLKGSVQKIHCFEFLCWNWRCRENLWRMLTYIMWPKRQLKCTLKISSRILLYHAPHLISCANEHISWLLSAKTLFPSRTQFSHWPLHFFSVFDPHISEANLYSCSWSRKLDSQRPDYIPIRQSQWQRCGIIECSISIPKRIHLLQLWIQEQLDGVECSGSIGLLSGRLSYFLSTRNYGVRALMCQ